MLPFIGSVGGIDPASPGASPEGLSGMPSARLRRSGGRSDRLSACVGLLAGARVQMEDLGYFDEGSAFNLSQFHYAWYNLKHPQRR